ncbi:hypothetical protein [Natrarchaeobius chitinivorans]|uniref:Uncharacterized protein n=1 Tax=Natrarchaeobius chitinivorans TaxID=1679083 RepID=A0A3N6LU53_NATCH|nr:hypothetical protein [Natrarchaeobius chitinivorans]RQG93778.1 hypothetical protein EA473_13720 [Natrarchaeobius chitinivorans]
MVVATAVVFLVSLLLGAVGIYAGARIIVGANDFDHAIVTALLGAIVWTVVGYLVGWIPLLGPVVALVAYVGVINWRYSTDWTAAAMIGLLAWITVLAVLYVLALVGVTGFEAVGVPGV